MKKLIFLALGLMLMVAGAFSQVSAFQVDDDFKTTVMTNDTQKGSLMIFPKIQVAGDPNDATLGEVIDTVIEINNDFTPTDWNPNSGPANLVCYYSYVYNVEKLVPDPVNPSVNIKVIAESDPQFMYFTLTINPGATEYWSVRSGRGSAYAPILYMGDDGKGFYGELKCWATDASHNYEVSYNHLYGNATVFYATKADAAQYNSWNFQAYFAPTGLEDYATPGELSLDGIDYDACPEYLVSDYFAKGRTFALGTGKVTSQGSEISLASCVQDYAEKPKIGTTKVTFEIYFRDSGQIFNTLDNLTLMKGKSFAQTFLSDPVRMKRIYRYFTKDYYQENKARLVVRTDCYTDATWTCQDNYADIPVVGTIFNFFSKNSGAQQFVAGTNFNTSNMASEGSIFWPTQAPEPESQP